MTSLPAASVMIGTCLQQRWNSSLPRRCMILWLRSPNTHPVRVLSASATVAAAVTKRNISVSFSLAKSHHFYWTNPAPRTPTVRWMSTDDNDIPNVTPPSSPSTSESSTSESLSAPPPPIPPPPMSRMPPRIKAGSFHAGEVMTGTVKFYLRDKGYGFIVADGRPNTDLFVHRGSIICTHSLSEMVLNATPKYPYLKQNERVRFVVSNDMGTVKAVNVTWLNGDAIPPERKNYLGGVYERSHRIFGEACMNVMRQKADIRAPWNDQEYEKIHIAYIESIRSIEHAERILIELGMDIHQFPTIKAINSTRGRYLFQHEVDEENGKAIEKAIAAANNSQPPPKRSNAAFTAPNTNSPNKENGSNRNTGQRDGMADQITTTSSVFDVEVLSDHVDTDDDMYSNNNAPYKH